MRTDRDVARPARRAASPLARVSPFVVGTRLPADLRSSRVGPRTDPRSDREVRLARAAPRGPHRAGACRVGRPETSTIATGTKGALVSPDGGVMRALFVLGRVIFGGFFAYNGINHFIHR